MTVQDLRKQWHIVQSLEQKKKKANFSSVGHEREGWDKATN